MQKKLLFIIGVAILGFVTSCTDLEETTYHDMLKSRKKVTEGQIGSSILMPVYNELRQIAGHNDQIDPGDPWEEQSYCTDQCLVPTRGGDWYDGGHFQRLFEHTWTYELPDLNTCWKFGFGRVNSANYAINDINTQFTDTKVTAPFIAELKMIRSFGYFYLIDFFGNVPIITKYDTTHTEVDNNPDFTTGRKQLFDTIVNDINSSIPYLTASNDAIKYGRFNKWAAFALLAKMYINAEVWAGKPMYDECIAACDSILDNLTTTKYQLEPDYFTNFLQQNKGSKENIFTIPYDQSLPDRNLCFYLLGQHYSEINRYKTNMAPWNGFCALPDHYKSFEDADVRRKGWEVGAQFGADGKPLKCIRETAPKDLVYTAEFEDIYDPTSTIKHDYKAALEYNGARFVKYEIAKGLPSWCMGNGLAIFRLADIYMLKAEALMRKNGGTATQAAVDLVNKVRARAKVSAYTTGTLTLTELLAERGREFYHEGMRRQDLIRFGKFVRGTWGKNKPTDTPWFDRSGESDTRNVYPIPKRQMDANPGYTQNPGY